MQRKRAPPCRGNAVEIVGAAFAQHRAHVDNRDAECARLVVECVDGLDDGTRARCGTRTIGRLIEMTAVQVDGNDGGLRRIEIILEAAFGVVLLAVDVDAHGYLRSSRTCGCPSAPGSRLTALCR